ncbi:hypothetical protein BDD12DRAFT_800780 [Trichophaea hybrida]|nr:hypothetical protein BDD12DRAFT_800780 [Trichophaea hybrida]
MEQVKAEKEEKYTSQSRPNSGRTPAYILDLLGETNRLSKPMSPSELILTSSKRVSTGGGEGIEGGEQDKSIEHTHESIEVDLHKDEGVSTGGEGGGDAGEEAVMLTVPSDGRAQWAVGDFRRTDWTAPTLSIAS